MTTSNQHPYDRFLDRLHAEGWSYGIMEWVDTQSGQRYWQLDQQRGDEVRIWRVRVENLTETFR